MSNLPSLSNCVLRHPERWSGLSDEVRRIELVITTAPEEIKDKCKTLCDTVLKTMLISSGTKTELECDHSDMNNLKAWSSELLELNQRDGKLVKAEITFLYEGRNSGGISGHGRSLQRQHEIRSGVNDRENERYLSVCDSLLSDLIYRFEAKYPTVSVNDRNQEFDASIDSDCGPFSVLSETYTASEVLYNLSPDIYRMASNESALEEQNNHEN